MTAARFLADESAFWTNAAVTVPVIFLAIFSFAHHWWLDTYGRCLGLLAVAMFGARLAQVLPLWHLHDTWVKWISVNALGIGPIVFSVLSFKLAQPHLPWVRRKRNAIEDMLREEDLRQRRRSIR